MSERYDLPDGVDSSRAWVRTLLVWGLPLAAWAAVIIGWFLFAGGDPSTPDPAPPEPPPAPAVGPEVAEQAQAVQEEEAPEQPPATQDYDFRGAVADAGLPNEALCKTGILVDPVTRKVLWAKNADRAVPIASMSKMMTMLLTEEAIAAGRVSLDTPIKVTNAAYEIGGSQVWLDPRETFPLGELVKTIAIKSANDSAYLVAEYLGGGDVAVFVKAMNDRAQALGMKNTRFYDAHGLGDGKGHHNLSSAHDLVLLAERLIQYPDVMRLASTRMDAFRDGKMQLRNSNNLVFNRVAGVDGLKTGFTDESGFCVTVTCLRGGRRLIGCVTGFKTSKQRDAFCKALLDWGYAR